MIVIVDYGLGNLFSVKNMLKSIGVTSEISSDPDVIASAKKIILPGVGNFEVGIKNLRASPCFNILENKVLQEKTPLLGICLGMQLLSSSSEESKLEKGLGWIAGKTVKFIAPPSSSLKIPHIGWADVTVSNTTNLLFKDLTTDARFYFVHSYHVVCDEKNDEVAHAHYGYNFCCAIQNENIMGVQFHPEKSHFFGKKLLKNFIDYYE